MFASRAQSIRVVLWFLRRWLTRDCWNEAEQRLMGRHCHQFKSVCVCVVDCERAHYQEAHSFSCCSLRKQIRRAAVACVCVCVCVCYVCVLVVGRFLSLASVPHSSGWSDWSRDLSRFSVSWVNLTKTRCISHWNQEKEIRHFWALRFWIMALFLWQLNTFFTKLALL